MPVTSHGAQSSKPGIRQSPNLHPIAPLGFVQSGCRRPRSIDVRYQPVACDCSSARLKPEAAHLAIEPAKEAAVPSTVGGETPGSAGAARPGEPSVSLSRTVALRASFNLVRSHSICPSVQAVNG